MISGRSVQDKKKGVQDDKLAKYVPNKLEDGVGYLSSHLEPWPWLCLIVLNAQ